MRINAKTRCLGQGWSWMAWHNEAIKLAVGVGIEQRRVVEDEAVSFYLRRPRHANRGKTTLTRQRSGRRMELESLSNEIDETFSRRFLRQATPTRCLPWRLLPTYASAYLVTHRGEQTFADVFSSRRWNSSPRLWISWNDDINENRRIRVINIRASVRASGKRARRCYETVASSKYQRSTRRIARKRA